LPFLFALTLFVSAALLFFVQPMIAKVILPNLGGSPAVWNTCMLFFQAALLAGYAFVHFVMTRLSDRLQGVLQIVLLLLPLAMAFPIGLAPGMLQAIPYEANPAFWLLALLAVSVGLPFFVVSTNSPLLQKWFSATGHATARDPYFLYGASNLGSMLALLGYPILVEPHLHLLQQRWLWTVGYGLLLLLTVACAAQVWNASRRLASSPSHPLTPSSPHPHSPSPPHAPLAWRRRLRWLALAFVPSSLMLAVTTYLSTDIASIPLLWVVPLAIYLATFILVFARRIAIPYRFLSKALAVAVLLSTIILLSEAEPEPVWVFLAIPLATLFVAAMVCHGELAQDRPPAEYLSEFYLWMSLGGALGGLFNALVAPVIFDRIAEYPLALVLACLCRPAVDLDDAAPPRRWLDVALPLGIGVVTAALVLSVALFRTESAQLNIILMLGLPAVLCYMLVGRPIRFALGVAVIMLASTLDTGMLGRNLYRERNFFGALRVTRDPADQFNQLVHGNTLHGRQRLDPEKREEPLAYYTRGGPIGDVFATFNPHHAKARIAVVGLGIGSLAAYAQPEQEWTFYEIDPAVQHIAEDTRYFTFLHDHKDQLQPIIPGDARLRLREAPPQHYDLIVLDAFSSDAIPVHLLTQEAVGLYLDKLADGGLLAFHISNRYLDLRPVLGNLARHHNLSAQVRDDREVTPEEKKEGKEPSMWVALARSSKDLVELPRRHSAWLPLRGQVHGVAWSDDFSDIWSVFQWK
jgi:hypothetical protein